MLPMPRVALGTVQPAADPTPMLWALVGYLQQAGQQVQIFHDQARFADSPCDGLICGQTARYLDSWLMSPALCRQSFLHGASGSDLALVVGRYASAQLPAERAGGNLEDLCNWLDLPQLAVVDVSLLEHCVLPPRPAGIAGVLLDRVPAGRFHYWQTTLEALWGVPVLASLPVADALRKQINSASCNAVSPCTVCEQLGQQLARYLSRPKLAKLAQRADLPLAATSLFCPGTQLAGVTVAVAYDEAFQGYFPDVLDLLELQGATVVDFSPLRDEALPQGTDVVYIGSGHPQRYAAQLANNYCMTLALRDHVRQGRRAYAEGGGLAYLCQTIRLPSGQYLPMAGVLPAVAIYAPDEARACPVELTLSRDLWLGPQGFTLRGYLETSWHVEPAGRLEGCVAEPHHPWLLAARRQAIGSRLQLNFAAQADFVRQFAAAGDSPLNASPAR